MGIIEGTVEVRSFLAVTLGILVLFLGKVLNRRFVLLREFTIPEPVSGGLLVATVFALLHWSIGLEVSFGMRARDLLLVVFFTTVGMNASFADLRRGGRSLVVLLSLTIVLMLGQNLLGIGLARWGGLPAATFGLILASASGGPIARFSDPPPRINGSQLGLHQQREPRSGWSWWGADRFQ